MHKSDEILDDMAQLTVEVIKYIELKRVPYAVKDQLIRAASSIGANYSEAQNASSKRDFINKVYIAKKESGEAKYWLGIVEKLVGNGDEMTQLAKDVQGFSMMFQKIISTSKEKTGTRASRTDRALSISTR
ncbi:four helix bundle protein [Aeromicrobium sp.]|nr:four helix bundle protein [Candidatus Saccharibacteria bacterium]